MIWSVGRRPAYLVAALVGLVLLATPHASPSSAVAVVRGAATAYADAPTTSLAFPPSGHGATDSFGRRPGPGWSLDNAGAPHAGVKAATGVAAEAVGLAPTLDKAFQFGGAGRSGAGVKNFVGPESSVVRGASPGRIFVTDDHGRVILDITRDRVKPVVPGQGFISGDGRKLTPTEQQLSWIDELWGG